MSVAITVSPVSLAEDADGLEARLLVLEVTMAAVVARLPKEDFEEVVSLLVFIAKGTDAASVANVGADAVSLTNWPGHHAASLLERIEISRRQKRGVRGMEV